MIANRQTQVVRVQNFLDAFQLDVPPRRPGARRIFAVVAVAGWVLLNRTTFGRRTIAVGGNPEAARLAGINVKRHTTCLYALAGLTAGIGVMMRKRTTAGSSTNGLYYEARRDRRGRRRRHALAGGHADGTIVGAVLGVLIF